MKYSGTFLLKFKNYQCFNNDIWQRIGYLGIRKKYRGKRSGKNKHCIAVTITSRNTRLLDHRNRRFHNPSNCVIPKLLNCGKTYDLPNFLVLNARSVAGKGDELHCINDQHEFQIICIAESWLSEAIPKEAIALCDYDIIRCDRTGEKGGGVALLRVFIGLRRYRRLMFGINGASKIFQNTTAELLAGLPGCKNISDDIIVYGKDQLEHDLNLQAVLQCLSDYNVRLNKDKCHFSHSQVCFYGHIFSAKGVQADPAKIDSIQQARAPQNVSEVKSLLGLSQYDSSPITLPSLLHFVLSLELTPSGNG
ncbi:Hypothetical predicted protein [Paramuricea clavata]|uniref:Reverse transcriptase domain-containing protein n=1 Tax=Paramuricea clavata TaxID=317549 RepID=A0A7D9E3L3_PARCT|nr:Hypothetical predicted protein [Paramuricea clavata]